MSEYADFIASRDRQWWRRYYADVVEAAELHLKRPLTFSERKLVVQAIRHSRDWNWLGSSGVLGMQVSMAIETPDRWMPILFAKISETRLVDQGAK